MRSTIKREAATVARYPKTSEIKKEDITGILCQRLSASDELTSWRTDLTFESWPIRS